MRPPSVPWFRFPGEDARLGSRNAQRVSRVERFLSAVDQARSKSRFLREMGVHDGQALLDRSRALRRIGGAVRGVRDGRADEPLLAFRAGAARWRAHRCLLRLASETGRLPDTLDKVQLKAFSALGDHVSTENLFDVPLDGEVAVLGRTDLAQATSSRSSHM